jgi:hypothetical protein
MATKRRAFAPEDAFLLKTAGDVRFARTTALFQHET